jgi:hypothetical protein
VTISLAKSIADLVRLGVTYIGMLAALILEPLGLLGLQIAFRLLLDVAGDHSQGAVN